MVEQIRHRQYHDRRFFPVNGPHDTNSLVGFEDELDQRDVFALNAQVNLDQIPIHRLSFIIHRFLEHNDPLVH